MRPPTACLSCRSRRRKCTVPTVGEPCVWCATRNVHCSLTLYTHDSDLIGQDAGLTQISPIATSDLPPRTVCEDIIIAYFKFIHDTCQWMFHKPAFLEDFRHGRTSDRILYGIIAIAARFCTNSFFGKIEPRKRAAPYAKRAAELLDPRDVSVESIQLCVLLASVFSFEGEPFSEATYYGIACRMATLLKLDKLPAVNALSSEINVRLLWTLKMSDVWTSAGNRVERMLPPLPSRYPMDERSFQLLKRDSVETTGATDNTVDADHRPSILSSIIQLNDFLERIADQILAMLESSDPLSGSSTAVNLCDELEAWRKALHPSLQDTAANLTRHAQEGEGQIFLSLYLGYYHYGQLLYFQYLHQYLCSGSAHDKQLAGCCKTFAAALCDLLYRAYQTPGAQVYYPMVGHVLVIASIVQIHTVLFGDDADEISAAKERLERNYQILMELLHFWPVLDVSIARLQTFHDTCLEWKESSFRMDLWMQKFLLEATTYVPSKSVATVEEIEYAWPLWSPPRSLLSASSPKSLLSGSDAG